MDIFQNDSSSTPSNTKSREREEPQSPTVLSKTLLLVQNGLLCGSLVLTLSAVVDRLFYGVWTSPAINFLYFNVFQSIAVFYGNNDWHYYLGQGYPLLLTTILPFALVGMSRIITNSQSFQRLLLISRRSLRRLTAISIVLPAALSVLSHKEVRFIYPILGPLTIIATAPVYDSFGPLFQSTLHRTKINFSTQRIRTAALAVLLLLSVFIAGYVSIIHNSGLIALPDYLRREFTTHYAKRTNPQNMTVGILMPCHSIPWRSHLHHPPSKLIPGIQAWALTCEPPLHLSNPAEKRTYQDEADIFYANPLLWLRKNMSPHRPPSGIHTDPSSNSDRANKYLWKSTSSSSSPSPGSGLDITDLLPYLRTSPDSPAPILTRHCSTSNTDGLPPCRPWPDYLAFFAQLEPTLTRAGLLHGSSSSSSSSSGGPRYVECWRRFNSHWHDDWRRTGDIVVWCLFPNRAADRGHSERSSGAEHGGAVKRDEKGSVVAGGEDRKRSEQQPQQRVLRP